MPATTRRELLKQLGGTAAAFAFVAAAGPLATAAPAAAAPAGSPATRSATAGPRVRGLLARLTLDEKISLVHGAADPRRLGQAGYLPGVARLGIPELRLTDGPAGVNVARSATGLPPVSTLGAAFNPELARAADERVRYGSSPDWSLLRLKNGVRESSICGASSTSWPRVRPSRPITAPY